MLLIGNGRLITRDSENPYIEDGCAAVDGSLILETGTTAEMRAKYRGAEFLDAKGGLVMPGFINAHMHFYSEFSRGMAVPGAPAQDFSEVLERLWWKLDKALTLEDVYYSAMCGLVEAIKSGCTTIIDHHASPRAVTGSLSEIARAAMGAGVRSSLCYEVSDRDGADIANEGIRENAEFIKWAKAQNSAMISGKFGLHASFTLSGATLEKCREAADPDAGFHVHVAEGAVDEDDCVKRYGKRIVSRFHDYGLTGKNSIFVHCIHIDGEEEERLRDTETAVVHNPESNMGNAVGAAKVTELMKRGILLGLGTDGYVSDMLQSWRIGNALCKHSCGHPNVGWAELPAMLFDNNAAIAERCFPVKIGKIKPGFAADVIVLDYLPPTEMDGSNVNGQLLFGASGRNVVATIANGKVLMKDRRLTTLDRDEIFAKARACAARVWKRL